MKLLSLIEEFDEKKATYLTSTETVYPFLKNLFDEYNTALQASDIFDDLVSVPLTVSVFRKRVQVLSDGILKTLETINDNNIDGRAYQIFEDNLKESKTDYWIFNRNKFTVKPNIPFYRLRKSEVTNTIEMFHLPFQLKGKASEQRFSKAGYPMLYLCNNIYTGWRELRKPDNFSSSKFFKIIDAEFLKIESIPFKTQKIGLSSEEIPTLLINYAVVFPLTVACLLTVKNDSDESKEEYTIPQILLEFIKKTGVVDGIAYNSTQINLITNEDEGEFISFVIPPKLKESSGHCNELKHNFSLSNPIFKDNISTNLIQASDASNYCVNAKKVTLDSTQIPYSKSTFAHIENELSTYPVNTI